MGVPKNILTILEESLAEAEEASDGKKGSLKKDLEYRMGTKLPVKAATEVRVVGFPVTNLKWDDIGLGMIRNMGYIPTKSVELVFRKGEWQIAGSYASSSVIFYILAGAGGLLYFLQDLVAQIEDWGWIASMAFFIIPTLANLFVRNRVLKFKPYELEMLAYDNENNVMVLSTLTQPGGVVALKVNLSKDIRLHAKEQQRLIRDMKKIHPGFTTINGLAVTDVSKIKSWSLNTLLWLIVIGLYYEYFM